MLKYSNPFWHLRNTGNSTHVRSAPGVYKRRRTNWSGTRYGGMPPRARGYYRRSGYWRRDGRTAGGSVEMKFFDKQLALSAGNHTAGLAQDGPIVGLSQGTGEQDRQGRKIIVKSLYVRAHINLVSSLGQGTNKTGQQLRVMLVEERQANGALFTIGELLETPPVGVPFIHAANNLSNKNRFKIHLDKVYSLNYPEAGINSAGTLYYQQGKTLMFKLYKKMNLNVEFSGTGTSSMSQIQSSNLSWVFITELTDANVQIEGLSRIRFVG